ncbi:hypothetical protein ACU686_26380 [Yinghuangia aomiensis]
MENQDTVAEEVAARLARLEQLYSQVSRLGGAVAALNARHVNRTRPWVWATMPSDQALECWAELLGWMREVFAPRFPTQFRVIRACWYQHPDVVEELSALHLAWSAAYEGPDASPVQALTWLHRWLPASEQRLDTALRQCDTAHQQLYSGFPPYTDQTVALWVAARCRDTAG